MPADEAKAKKPPRGTADAQAAMPLAWPAVGTLHVTPYALTMATDELNLARNAKQTLQLIVRDAGRPGNDDRRRKVAAELAELCGNNELPATVKRDVLWMLSEIAGDEEIDAVANLLGRTDLREDARMVLERIPGEKSLAALQSAMETANRSFKPNLAQSLRKRGQKVSGYPCQKLVPVKQTEVKPVGR